MATPTQTLIKVKDWNAYVHLPSDYGKTTKTYPTIIFIPGLGEIGTDPNRLIQNGPGAYLNQGWDGSALGVQFIVISLQPPAAWPRPWTVKEKIDLLKSQYRIGDYYMTGLSMGGWTALWYSYYYPNEIKKIVGVESVVPTEPGPDGKDNIIDTYKPPAMAGQYYLLFEQKNDYRRNDQVVDAINHWNPGHAFYQYTEFGGGGHCCWNEFYGGNGKEPGRFNIGGNALNLYEWLAGAHVLPDFITKVAKRGNELSWHCENAEDGDYFIIEETKDFKNFKQIAIEPAAGSDYKFILP